MQEWKVTFYNKHCSYGPPVWFFVEADTEADAVEVAKDHTLNHTRPAPPYEKNVYFELVKIEPYARPRGRVVSDREIDRAALAHEAATNRY